MMWIRHNITFLVAIVILGLYTSAVIGQSAREEVSELLKEVDLVDDHGKMNIYLDLATSYQRLPNMMDSVRYYAQLAILLATEQENNSVLHSANYRLGMASWYGDEDFDQALVYFIKARSIIVDSNSDLDKLPQVENAIGCIYMIQGEFDTSLEAFQLAYDGSTEINDYEVMAMAGTNMGMIYIRMGDTLNCMQINEQSIRSLEDINDPALDHTKAAIMINLGDLYRKTNQYDKAKDLIIKIRKIVDKSGDFRQDGRVSILEARVLDETGDKEKLYRLVNQKLKEIDHVEGYDREIYTSMLIYQGMGYAENGYKNEANQVVKKLENFLGVSNNKHQINLLRSLHLLEKEIGDFESAYHYSSEYHQLKDSISNQVLQDKLVETEKKYQLEKKERLIEKKQNENLELKSYINKLLLWGLLLLLVGLGLYIRYYSKSQQEKERMNQIEQKILALQMNPHFIFNAISSIQNYLFDAGDTKKAIMHLSTFATLMRQMLENSRERFIPLNDEIDFLKNYLELQKLRFDNKFEYEITIQPDIDTYSLAIPPLLTQPFIENAIEHGKIYNVNDGLLKIDISKDNNRLIIKIMDNGEGLSPQKKVSEKSEVKKSSLSIKITNERLGLLSKLMNKKWNLQIQNRAERGTVVHFNIPAISMSQI